MSFRPGSLRMRLTLWYATALAVILLLYAAAVYTFVSHTFYGELDRLLRGDFETAAALLGPEAGETIIQRLLQQQPGVL